MKTCSEIMKIESTFSDSKLGSARLEKFPARLGSKVSGSKLGSARRKFLGLARSSARLEGPLARLGSSSGFSGSTHPYLPTESSRFCLSFYHYDHRRTSPHPCLIITFSFRLLEPIAIFGISIFLCRIGCGIDF